MMAPPGLKPMLQYTTLIFWCVLYGVIAFTNACDVLHRRRPRHVLSRFRAQNLQEVETAVATVEAPPGLAGGLFALVIMSQAVVCLLFAGAVTSGLVPWVVHWALVGNVLVWQAFVVADSVFRTYQFTVCHAALMCAGLLTAGLFLF